MTYEFLEYEVQDRIGFLTLNRPEKRNALNDAMIAELKNALASAAEDPKVKVIVLKANGKVFSAGADLGYLQQLQKNTYEENLEDSRRLMELFRYIYEHPKLIIAQVQGHAIAGGCGLATVCDLCYAVPEAKFGYTEVGIGFIPALVSIFLTRKIGEGKAKELLLTGRLIPAAEASATGLINGVVEASQIAQYVKEQALHLCAHTSGQSITLTKYLLSASQGLDINAGLALAAEMNAKARGTEDCRKGISHFLGKKEITW